MSGKAQAQDNFDQDIWSSFETLWEMRTEEEKSFLEYFSQVYFFALKKRNDNRNTYLKLAKSYAKYTAFTKTIQNVFTPLLSSAWKLLSVVVAGGFLGNNIFMQNWPEQLETLFSKLLAASMITALSLLIICGVIFLTRIIYIGIKFENEENILQRKETWIRHSEALFAYQYEICLLRFRMHEYAELDSTQMRKLFMKRITNAVKANNDKFVSNMTRER